MTDGMVMIKIGRNQSYHQLNPDLISLSVTPVPASSAELIPFSLFNMQACLRVLLWLNLINHVP